MRLARKRKKSLPKALLQHPAVHEAAAFAVPHPRLGENVAAAVVLNDGADATSSTLVEFLHDRLAPFQMPRHVHLLPVLPKGTTGKISRAQLGRLVGLLVMASGASLLWRALV